MPVWSVIKGIYSPVVTGYVGDQHLERCSLTGFRPLLVFKVGKGIQEPLLYTKQDSSHHSACSTRPLWESSELLQSSCRPRNGWYRLWQALNLSGNMWHYWVLEIMGTTSPLREKEFTFLWSSKGKRNWKGLFRMEAKVQLALLEGGAPRLEATWDRATGSEAERCCPSAVWPSTFSLRNHRAAVSWEGKVTARLCLKQAGSLKAAFAHQKPAGW